MKQNKITYLLAAALTAACITGCGTEETTSSPEAEEQEEEEYFQEDQEAEEDIQETDHDGKISRKEKIKNSYFDENAFNHILADLQVPDIPESYYDNDLDVTRYAKVDEYGVIYIVELGNDKGNIDEMHFTIYVNTFGYPKPDVKEFEHEFQELAQEADEADFVDASSERVDDYVKLHMHYYELDNKKYVQILHEDEWIDPDVLSCFEDERLMPADVVSDAFLNNGYYAE